MDYGRQRKRMQESGDIPEWMTTAGWQLYATKYLSGEAKNVREQYRRIASTLAQYAPKETPEWWLDSPYFGNKTWEEAFFSILWDGFLSPSTPVSSNTGTDLGLSVSCSGQVIPDSVYGFYDTRLSTAILTKNGFGTSAYLGDIRPRGAPCKSGTASGVLPVFKMFVQDSMDISQGSQRRGAWAGYLPIEHDDYWEVINWLEHQPESNNVGWNLGDDFKARLDAGEEEAVKRWKQMLYVKSTIGKGYQCFIDKINRHRPQMYKDHNLVVKASQLCVAPETLVLTDKGHVPIIDLVGTRTNVWNGEEYSDVEVVKTGENQKLITVKTASGFELQCTPYHKFYVKEHNQRGGKVVEKRAIDLQFGDKLIKLTTPIVEGGKDLNLSYENGFYSGDGCTVNGKARIYLYNEKRLLSGLFSDKLSVVVQEKQNREYFYLDGLQPKYFVPSADYTVASRVNWLAGLLDSDGCVCRNGNSQTLQIASVEVGFLEQVQLMLQTLGVQSKVVHGRDAGEFKLPANDGSGELKTYNCKKVVRLLVGGTGITQLQSLGLSLNRLVLTDHTPNRDATGFVKVLSVVDDGRVSDTYCFTEPKRHMGVFNGLLTGQCTEISLFADAEHDYTCVLSSLCLQNYRKFPKKLSFVATVFLDCVCEDFIQRGSKIKGLEKAVRYTQKARSLGLGVMGWGTLLMQERTPFGSLESFYLNSEVFKTMQKEGKEASQWMAQVLGEPEWCKGYGVRNTHITAIAPTKSTSLLMGGCTEGINPPVAMAFTQVTPAGEMQRIDPTFLAYLREHGKYNKKVVEDIINHKGSVQHLSWMNEEDKLIFRTAFEIDPYAHLNLCAQRQKLLCQMQSINLYLGGNISAKFISELYRYAYENEDIHSLYYQYSMRDATISNDSGCIACE